jgi:F-type H+-transporting ATPase subunit epsilon
MAATLKFRIVTPDGELFACDAEYVSLPSVMGDLGIYPNHIPLITTAVAGELMVRTAGKELHYVIGRSLIELTGNHVSVVTDDARDEAAIDEQAAEEALRRAKAALEEKVTGEELAAVEASLARASAQIQFKRRRRTN